MFELPTSLFYLGGEEIPSKEEEKVVNKKDDLGR